MKTDMVRPHKTLERNGVLALMLTEGEFSGIIFSYGRVSFDEDKENDKLKVKFDYTIHEQEPESLDKLGFEKELGDFLMELMAYGIIKNDLVYTGGVDENREVDPIELDSQ
jgi:hypothetical protein